MQYNQLNRTEKESRDKGHPDLSEVIDRLHPRELHKRYAS